VDASVDRVQEILKTPQMDIDGEKITPENRDIKAENIEFSYDRRKIIDGISLSIPEKSVTAIVGPSGGGKTTLVNLLARFWVPIRERFFSADAMSETMTWTP
jgi:ATP-binding cassette subfamily B protein